MVLINDDVYGIVTRIKSLDNDYGICYNNNFFITYKGKKILKVPYKQLDKRTVDFVYKTRINNVDFSSIEEFNKNLMISKNNEINYIARYKLKEQLGYLNNHSKIDYNTSDTTIWV